MTLSESFNSNYSPSKRNDSVLQVSNGGFYLCYDFTARILLSSTGDSRGGMAVTPFSQLDREVLEAHRDKLIELGGKPPELHARTNDMGKVAKLELG